MEGPRHGGDLERPRHGGGDLEGPRHGGGDLEGPRRGGGDLEGPRRGGGPTVCSVPPLLGWRDGLDKSVGYFSHVALFLGVEWHKDWQG